MSYCRWSTDNFACDLYCFESANGFVTHVASSRYVGKIPAVDWNRRDGETDDQFGQHIADEYKAQHDAIKAAEHKPIGLAFDGQSFTDETLEEFRARLIALREAGYRFPGSVIEAVDEEIAELGAPT